MTSLNLGFRTGTGVSTGVSSVATIHIWFNGQMIRMPQRDHLNNEVLWKIWRSWFLKSE